MKSNSILCIALIAAIFDGGGNLFGGTVPLTNTVPITHNLYFQLEKQFGPATNQFLSSEMIQYAIDTTATNHGVMFRYFPPDRSFVFKLVDSSGAAVAKTSRGLEYSKAPSIPRTMQESSKLHGYSDSIGGSLFCPEDMFVLTNKGVYELEVSIRLWVQTTNRGAPNELSELDQPGIGTNYQFGVVTSPPVRVRIISESTGQ